MNYYIYIYIYFKWIPIVFTPFTIGSEICRDPAQMKGVNLYEIKIKITTTEKRTNEKHLVKTTGAYNNLSAYIIINQMLTYPKEPGGLPTCITSSGKKSLPWSRATHSNTPHVLLTLLESSLLEIGQSLRGVHLSTENN